MPLFKPNWVTVANRCRRDGAMGVLAILDPVG